MLHLKHNRLSRERGQSLVELVIGIALGILFITGAIGIIVLTLRIGSQNKFSQTATGLTSEAANQIPIVTNADWHTLFDVSPHGAETPYYLVVSGGFLTISPGTESLSVDGQTYSRSFTIEDVYRDSDDTLVDTSGTVDPSTLKITITTSWVQNGETSTVQSIQYVTRNRSRIFDQSDWSGGSGEVGPFTDPNDIFASASNINYASIGGAIYIQSFSAEEASTSINIDSVNKWAWNDVIGWVDFNVTHTVSVTASGMTGYASSGVGYIALECTTSPTGNCDHPYGITNDGTGTLTGYAWNDAIGWISFQGDNYGVTIDDTTGDFYGWAWNDVAGWFSFNCANLATCGTVDYKTVTTWTSGVSVATLTSSILDTAIDGGAGFNTLLWQGTEPAGTNVKFQIATSNDPDGPWDFVGSDGTSASYYQPTGVGVQLRIVKGDHENKRYIRYKVILESNIEKTFSPLVTEVVIGWSP